MGNQFSVSGGMGFILSQHQKANDVSYKDQWAENKNKSKPLVNMVTFSTKNKEFLLWPLSVGSIPMGLSAHPPN